MGYLNQIVASAEQHPARTIGISRANRAEESEFVEFAVWAKENSWARGGERFDLNPCGVIRLLAAGLAGPDCGGELPQRNALELPLLCPSACYQPVVKSQAGALFREC